MQRYLYLSIDIAVILVPLLFSFRVDANFYKKWKHAWPAIFITAVFFLIWDEWFTSMGVWGFNPRYLMGIYFFHIPLEEILFFICIPYACLFTYEALRHFYQNELLSDRGRKITWVLIIGSLAVGVKNYDRWYPAVTFIVLAIYLLILVLVIKPDYMGKFYRTYLTILVPFFIVNGILTGAGFEEPVVWYSNHENLGIRILTIPLEDAFYGMLMILMTVSIFEWLEHR